MQREEHDLSAEARRELEALDRALAGEPVDAEFDAVARLSRELRSARPVPREEYTAWLDDRTAAGFPPAGAPPSSFAVRVREWFAGMRPMRLLTTAGAVATVVLVVSVAVIQSGGGDDATTLQEGTVAQPTGGGGREGAPLDAATEEQAPAAPGIAGGAGEGAASDSAIAPAPPNIDRDRVAPGRSDRKVERSASLALSTDEEDFGTVTDGVIETTDRYRGFVISSQESSTDERSRASFELAAPSERLQAFLADLSELGHVESRSEDSLDITAPTASARDRLTDARAEIDGLLRQLALADTTEETREIRFRLDIAREEAAQAKADVQRLARRANFANVAVTVTSDGSGDGEWGVSEALEDIEGALSTAAGVALISAAILLPLALLVALATVARRASVRRGRERALDEPL